MGNRKELVSSLQELREDNIRKQKRGLHFIVASVFIWVAVLGIHISSLPILSKNLFTFCCSTPLVPLAFLLSKILKIDFQNKENPLSGLGLLISLNQMLYNDCYVGICSYARKNADGLCYNFWSPPFAIWLAISIKNILCFFYFDTDYCIVAWDICSDIFCGGIYAYHRDNFL